MSVNASRLLAEMLGLPENERAEIAARLIDSLDSETDPDYAAVWDAEIGRRIDELESGSVKLVPWTEARKRILGAAHGTPST